MALPMNGSTRPAIAPTALRLIAALESSEESEGDATGTASAGPAAAAATARAMMVDERMLTGECDSKVVGYE